MMGYSDVRERLELELEIGRLLQVAYATWAEVATQHRLDQSSVSGPRYRLPKLSGYVSAVRVDVTSDHAPQRGFETEVRSTANYALRGKVLVRPASLFDEALAGLGRAPFGVPRLDAKLGLRAHSKSLRRAVIDERTIETLSLLVDRGLQRFRYDNGEIEFRWGGVERSATVLGAVLECAAYLAVLGPERSPYR